MKIRNKIIILQVLFLLCLTSGCTKEIISVEYMEGYPLGQLEGEIQNIAYSIYGLCNINTLEGYVSAKHYGFNCVKGDVRLTSDNKLVMCHDAGFTLNADGTIGKYDPLNCILIHNMTEAEVLALRWPKGRQAYQQRACSCDEYLYNCKKVGIRPYITIRGEYEETTAAVLLDLLKKYDFLDYAIVNSNSNSALEAVRQQNKTIILSKWWGFNNVMTKSIVDYCLSMSPCIALICSSESLSNLLDASEDAVKYAKENRVPLHAYLNAGREDYETALSRGIVGFQIPSMSVVDYQLEQYHFRIIVSEGKAYLSDKRYEADIEVSSGKIVLKGVKYAGTNNDFYDAISPFWFRNSLASAEAYDGNYKLTVIMSIDGVSIECSNDCYIDLYLSV